MKAGYADEVSASIIKQLEMGTAPWQKPWKAGERFMPWNPTTGNNYRGLNAIWLYSKGVEKEYSDSRWMTFKQANSVDAQVNKGEKGTLIQYYAFSEDRNKLDKDGKPVRGEDGKIIKEAVPLQSPKVVSATVFNATQISGLENTFRPVLPDWERHAQAEAILTDSGATIKYQDGDRAVYRPSTDSIILPVREQFPSADKFYATALHELGHWTGHESRLNRDLAHPFGSEGYAKEELRAEIASMMIGEQLSIGHDPGQHVAYVGSWIKALKENPREIFKASGDAERISKYLLGREMRQHVAQEQEPQDLPIPKPDLSLPQGDTMSNSSERVYVDVPYAEKEEAKALGAKWDRKEKSWYFPAEAESEFFVRWAKSNTAVGEDPQREFATALQAAGLQLDGSPFMDGELRRVRVEGDDRGQTSGTYKGHLDGHPAGYINNYKTGYSANWKSAQRNQNINANDIERLQAEAAERQEAKINERALIAEQTAEQVNELWIAAEVATNHPYLAAKGVQSHGLKVNISGPLVLTGGKDDDPQRWSGNGELLIPVMNRDGEIVAAQSLDTTGRKSFPRGSQLQGGHFILGEPGASDTILITEGYATGATLHELTGLPVVVAFNSGNLPAVAETIREKYPEKLLVITGDDDHTKLPHLNVGRLKAIAAAEQVGGYTLLPPFHSDDSGSDWNDLAMGKGKEAMLQNFSFGLKMILAKDTLVKENKSQTGILPQKYKGLEVIKEVTQSCARSISL